MGRRRSRCEVGAAKHYNDKKLSITRAEYHARAEDFSGGRCVRVAASEQRHGSALRGEAA
eukprot:12462743-Alexandrium_andersonii.AAC.1